MNYKKEFIKFMCDANVLTFGNFITKSGRNSPYFINTGFYSTGEQISKLGYFYSRCIKENNIKANVLFGPAYKGIPLCVSVASCLYKEGINISYAFNRKEIKDHGEGGIIVGHNIKPNDKIIIVEDVITSGLAIKESLDILKNIANVEVAAIIVSVDRMEKGEKDISAIQEIYDKYKIKVYPIVTIIDIIDAIKNNDIQGKEYLEKIEEYRKNYGIL